MFIENPDDLMIILSHAKNKGYSVFIINLLEEQNFYVFPNIKFKEIIFLTKRKTLFDEVSKIDEVLNEKTINNQTYSTSVPKVEQKNINNQILVKILESKIKLLNYVVIDPKNIRALVQEVD